MVFVMGLTVGKITGSSDGYMKVELYNKDGSYAGTMTVSTSKTSKNKKTSKSTQKKYKKLQYNFKRLSNQIMRTKTSTNAKQLVTKAKFQIANLRMKLLSGDYNYEEIHNALIHAERIARVAKKRMKNLEEEEYIAKTGRRKDPNAEELEEKREEENKQEEILDTTGMSREEMERLAQELQEEMERIEDELEEVMQKAEQLMEEFVQGSKYQMDPKDLEELKKKHRAEELRDIMKADMEYLKALFNKLAREKEAAGSGSSGSSDNSSDSSGGINISGVSLEIGGIDVPVEASVQAPVEVAGASVDVTV